jgi:hypothetical protein
MIQFVIIGIISRMKKKNTLGGIFSAGGATDCVQGARNEHHLVGGGQIRKIEMRHAVFIPPGAADDALVGNAGVHLAADGTAIEERIWGRTLTVGQAKQMGEDITEQVLRWTPPHFVDKT